MEVGDRMQVEAESRDRLVEEMIDQSECSIESEGDEQEAAHGETGDGLRRSADRQDDEAVQPEQSVSESHNETVASAQREDGVRHRESFGNIEIIQSLSLSPPQGPDYASFYRHVLDEFQKVVDRALPLAGPRDVVQVELRGQSLQSNVSMISRDGAQNVEQFQVLLEQLVQSNVEISTDQSLKVVIQIVRNQTGGMGQKRKLTTLMEVELVKKKGRFLYIVDNTDNMCFSINLAHLLDPGLDDAQASERGAEIHKSAGLSADSPVTFEDVSKFEKVLGCRIVVFYRQTGDQNLSKFVTGQPPGERTLLMLLTGSHYYGIKNLKGLLGYNFVCEWCFTGYDRKGSHSCSDCCSVCCDPDCPRQPERLTRCPDCNRGCRSAYCFEKHRQPTEQGQNGKASSRCEMVKKCPQCKYPYYSETHKCPNKKCKVCNMPLPNKNPDGVGTSDPHRCYIQPVGVEDRHCEKLVFYDFETFVNEKGEHVPFYVSTSTFSGESWCAEGPDCAIEFLKHFRQQRYKNFTFIAHNAKGFDSYLILKPMVEQRLTPSLIAQGSKILCFTDPSFKQRYIDSVSFLPMRLAQLPEALGFENSVKGYFPHCFSSESNLKYVGPYPRPEAYGVNHMSVSESDAFMKWYETVKHGEFDFNKEVKLYCQNDTDILRTACLKFREQFIKDTEVDPFSCVTIASACMKVFTSHHVPLNSIAIPAPDNYRTQSKSFSRVAIQWLEWEAHRRGVFIQHALNQGEKQFGPYFVDGYAVVNEEHHAFEFLGCFYHGCPTCLNPKDTNILTGETFGKMHEKTKEKLRLLQSSHGLNVTHIWEHDWQEMKENDQSVKTFLEKFALPEPLVPRDALYGGRTSAIRLRYTAKENETVSYADVNSLYPHVMCNSECFYPLDHPIILHRGFENPQNYFGLIHAKVYPPQGLFFPVLPSRTAKGKLLFTLCRQCGELNNQEGRCSHSEEERALTGVWVTPEFNKAVELGYRIGKIYEIWHFPKKSNDIFRDYMYRFLKGKQEASGYPSGVASEESKLKYIREHHEQQGIQLDPREIRFNPAKRQIAKLCLNSLWGKFGQRSNLLNSTLITKSSDFYHYLFSGKYNIHYFTFVSDKVALVQWRYNNKTIVPPGKVNVFIAAFTTAYGRLVLYEYLSQLQDRVLYHDTDSLVYLSRPGQSKLPMGEQLGELKDELSGDSIVEWVSSGPKSYAYKTSSGKVVLKAKGITQNYENCQQVCFDSLRDLVEGYIGHQTPGTADEMIIPQSRIVRDKKELLLRSITFKKRYRVVFDKRRLLPDGQTLPFGYQDQSVTPS